MKNRCLAVWLILVIITITGCNKYEKDMSYSTELYGCYSMDQDTYMTNDVEEITEESDVSYSENEIYKFKNDNTYEYMVNEVINGEVTKDNYKSGKVISIKEISNDITEINLDQEVIKFSTQESTFVTTYKYKNMLGDFVKTEVPKGKTFDLHLADGGIWFDKDGQFHIESDTNKTFASYIRKNNIIYFRSADERHKDCYTIQIYIVDGGMFFPKLYKE